MTTEREEIDRLTRELDEAKAENERLRHQRDKCAARLDARIDSEIGPLPAAPNEAGK